MTASTVNYTKFCEFLALAPTELSLLRFQELNIRNLLFYQAELIDLERQLRQIEEIDASLYPDLEKRVNYRWTEQMASKSSLITQPAAIPSSSTNQNIPTQANSNSTTSVANNPVTDLYIEKIMQIRTTLMAYSKQIA